MSSNIYLAESNATYNASPQTATDGSHISLQADANGNLKVYNASLAAGEDLTNNVMQTTRKVVAGTTYSWTPDVSFGTAVTHNSKATAGQVMSVDVTSVNGAVRYFQLFNSTGATTGTPIYSVPIPAGSSTVPAVRTLTESFFGPNGAAFSTGITWGISTSQATYVAATASDHNVIVHYV